MGRAPFGSLRQRIWGGAAVVFSSIDFLFYFLPVFLFAFYASGTNKALVLVGSLIFYAWGEPFYVFLLLLAIAMNYWLGLKIHDAQAFGRERIWLTIGVAANLIPLGFFKYLNFLVDTVRAVIIPGAGHSHVLDVPMPLGISFFTFHAISYLVDVYRKHVPPERSFRDLAIYISMFPQLIAGPIIRYKTIAKELHNPVLTSARTAAGIRLFIIGLAQKVLIANTVAVVADGIFELPRELITAQLAWLGIISYTIQIYFDFGGYSLMAIGLGLVIGFTFPRNFYYPYAARSITDFWRRWHITLSSWFRDYVYIPLGGNRVSNRRTYVNLVTVFLLCGLWHGAAWTFIIWGMLHGVLLVLERGAFGRILPRLPATLAHVYVLLAVMVTWVFFRSTSVQGALNFLQAMAGFGSVSPDAPTLKRFLTADVLLALGAGVVAAAPVVPALKRRWKIPVERVSVPAPDYATAGLATTGFAALLILSALSLAGGAYNPFIYFRF